MIMATTTPPRSLVQRMDALEKANDIRSYRAQLKRDVKARRKDPVAVIINPTAEVHTMKIMELLLATPKYGRVKVNKILNSARVSPSKTVGGLTDRQRAEIVRYVRQH